MPVYRGRFGPAQAERLLWRAGFGPRPGEAEKLAQKGLDRAVVSLTRPAARAPQGPDAPRQDGSRWRRPTRRATTSSGGSTGWSGQPAPDRAHDARLARLVRDLERRGRLAAADDRARTSCSAKLRARSRSSDLLLEVTRDPAMLIWLSGSGSTKDSPNENYGRELMELFTLGVGTRLQRARRARAGACPDRLPQRLGRRRRADNFHFDPDSTTTASKKIFGKHGRFDWRDSCQLCLEHKSHPSFFVAKLWSYFIPVAPPRRTQRALERLYRARDYDVRPVVEAILRHPLFYRGPHMVKPPIVYIAGLLRGMGRGIDTEAWVWLADLAGQQLFYPPDVAGWQEDRWLDTVHLAGHAGWPPLTASREKALEHGKDTLPLDEHAERGRPAGARLLGRSLDLVRDALLAGVVRQALPDRSQPQVEAGVVPVPDPERAARDGRHLSRPPDLLMAHHCCDDFSRTELLRRAASSTARALPDRTHACRCPPAADSRGAAS